MDVPRLSVIIPTYNRRQRLGRVLDALAAQTLEPQAFEVVVVDDGSKDGTPDWLRSQSYRFTTVVKQQENSGPAVARNTGVLNASADLVVFLDDDVVPIPDFLREHLASHGGAADDVAVIGPLASLPHYDQPWVTWEQVQVEKQYMAMQRGDYAATFRQFWTGNASVAREHVVAAGLFDPRFLRAEDVELGVRLHERGVKFHFNPKARGLHHAERSLDSWAKAHSSYGAFEVDIWSKLGTEHALDIFAGNFGRLRPEVRWLLRQCLDHPHPRDAVKASLTRFLKTRLAARSTALALPACSLLANLLYWQACRSALGEDRFSQVLARSQAGPNG